MLSKLPIGDVATQYFADRDMFCAGRVVEEDLRRTMKACGGCVLTTVQDLKYSNLGSCERFEEVQIGGERYNIFKGCPNSKTVTMILRGGAEQFIDETERSLHDAIMIVRRAVKNDAVVAGGGAIEMELSKYLRDYSRTVAGKEQLLIAAFAKALEVIPRQLCDNAGFDATNILNRVSRVFFYLDSSFFVYPSLRSHQVLNRFGHGFPFCVMLFRLARTNKVLTSKFCVLNLTLSFLYYAVT